MMMNSRRRYGDQPVDDSQRDLDGVVWMYPFVGHETMLIRISAAPSLTRSFTLPGLTQNDTSKTISIYEPTLTADNLGHKTWSSSYILSLHLPDLSHLIPPIGSHPRRVLELGSGTGLFGISFAALYSNSHVKLTDLPDIVPNLTINANKNVHLAEQEKSTISVEELDWNTCCTLSSTAPSSAINDTVLAADPIYSPSHPTLLTHAISANLCRGPDARLILGLPVRKAYLPQINEIWCLLFDMGLSVLEDGELHGTDDWTDAHGERVSVRVKWAVWAWKEQRMKA